MRANDQHAGTIADLFGMSERQVQRIVAAYRGTERADLLDPEATRQPPRRTRTVIEPPFRASQRLATFATIVWSDDLRHPGDPRSRRRSHARWVTSSATTTTATRASRSRGRSQASPSTGLPRRPHGGTASWRLLGGLRHWPQHSEPLQIIRREGHLAGHGRNTGVPWASTVSTRRQKHGDGRQTFHVPPHG